MVGSQFTGRVLQAERWGQDLRRSSWLLLRGTLPRGHAPARARGAWRARGHGAGCKQTACDEPEPEPMDLVVGVAHVRVSSGRMGRQITTTAGRDPAGNPFRLDGHVRNLAKFET